MKPEQERLRALLVDTIALLCKSGLGFKNELKIQGLLGMTIDGDEVFIVHIDETFPESPTPSRRNASAGRDAETKLVPEPVAEFNESSTVSVDNVLSPQSGSEVVRKRARMEVQPVKQERGEWEENASARSTMLQESSKIGMEDQNVIGNVSGSETKSSEVMWIDSDVLNDSKDRVSLESQPGHGFEAGNELVNFDRSTNDSCGLKLYNIPVITNTSEIIIKVENEKDAKSDIGRKHAYHQTRDRSKYSGTVVPLAVCTASVSPVYSTDGQWQTDEVPIVSYPIPTAVFCRNSDEETDQEDYQELSNWENNIQEPNRRSTQNGDRERRFVCQYDGCDKAFYRKDHLIRHQRSKHGKPFCHWPFVCQYDDCDKGYYRKDYLIRHQHDKHGKPFNHWPFVCQYDDCDKGFYNKNHLIRHQRMKHGKPFGVDSQTVYFCHFADCSRMFYNNTSLHKHMSDTHGYVHQQ